MAMLTKNYQSKATGFFVLTAIVLLSGAGLLLAKPVQLVVQNLKGSAHVFPVRSGKQLPSQKKALKNVLSRADRLYKLQPGRLYICKHAISAFV